MNAWFPRLAAALSAAALACHAAPPTKVETFDAQGWAALRAPSTKGAAIVFTTTDCTYCPGVLRQLAEEIRKRGMDAPLIAVVMDAAPGQDDAHLLSDPHHRGVDRLFAFSGQAAALRYGVNPAWRGVTPYTALVVKGRPPRWVTGAPSAEVIEDWAAAMAR